MDSQGGLPQLDPEVSIAVSHQSQSNTGSREADGAQRKNSNSEPDPDESTPLLVSAGETENPDIPRGVRFAVLFLCILLGDFFVGYDTSCVTTLTPTITEDFNTLEDFGWYGTSYLLTSVATVLIFGQIYSFYSMKGVFIGSFFLFVAGSLVSASAPSSAVFILGRAITGVGSAGVFAGGSIIVANITSLVHRPIYQALSGGVECMALAFGPLLAGAIAHASSWRFSFYVAVPIGLVIMTAVFFFVNDVQRPENAHLSTKEKFKKLDLPGFVLFLPLMTSLIIGLQWAGTQFAWDNWRIILLLVTAGVLLLIFVFAEYRTGEESMFPLATLRQRSVAFGTLFTFCNSGALFVVGSYLPIYFQAIRNASALESGLMYLPTAAAFAISILVAGPLTTLVGYYSPVMVVGSILSSVGVALITTFKPDTPVRQWILYQIIYGVGVGLAFQQPYTAVQTVLVDSKVPTALVMLSFTQEIGGLVALSISQNIFLNHLAQNLADQVPGLDPRIVLDNGALGIIDAVPERFRVRVLQAYNGAILDVFYVALTMSCLTLVGAVCIEWRSVKEEKTAE